MRRTSALIALLAATPVLAQDGSLYPDPDAPDAAYLRVLAPEGGPVRIDGAPAEATGPGMTAYREVAPGPVTLTIDGTSHEIEAAPNTHYTWADGALVTDTRADEPGQAGLTAYNLAEAEGVELYVPEADAVALSGIAPGGSETVALKAPLTLDFTVRSEGESVASIDAVELRRGTGTSVVLLPAEGGEGLQAVAIADTYAE